MTFQPHDDSDDEIAARAEARGRRTRRGRRRQPSRSLNLTTPKPSRFFSPRRRAFNSWNASGRRGGLEDPGDDRCRDREGVPTSFGRFRIVGELGGVDLECVFLAIDPDLNRPVALKLPLAEALLKAEVRHRFVREAKASASLDHPNLVPLYEAGEIDSICYLASAYCEGPTLGCVAPRAAIGRPSRSRGPARGRYGKRGAALP